MNCKILVRRLLLSCSFLLSSLSVFSQTEVSGIISTNTVWKIEDSPIHIVGSTKIAQGITLMIEAGVTVKISGTALFQIDGTLVANGSQENKITFTSMEADPKRGDWNYIHFTDMATDAVVENGAYKSGSLLQYCIFKYGGNSNNGALFIEKSSPYITGCQISESSSHGIKISLALNIIILNTRISENLGDGIFIPEYGYDYYNRNDFMLKNSEVSYNQGKGIHFMKGVPDDNVSVIDSKIHHNAGGVYIRSEGGSGRGTVQITGCEISENVATQGGGVSMERGHHLIFKNNLVKNNSGTNGGGLYMGYGWDEYTHAVENNIFTGNIAENGAAVYMDLLIQSNKTNVSISRNFFVENRGINSILFLGDSFTSLVNTKTEYNDFNGNSAVSLVDFYQYKGTFSYNNFRENSCTYLFKNFNEAGTPDVIATHNYLAGLTTDEIDEKIYDWLDDASLSSIIYDPTLDAPIDLSVLYTKLVSPAYVCENSNVEVELLLDYYFTPDNKFILQLSDQYGSFQNAVNLDTLEAGQKLLQAVLPDTLLTNKEYLIRVISTVSDDASIPISIEVVKTPSSEFSISSMASMGDTLSITYTAMLSDGVILQWDLNGGMLVENQKDSLLRVHWPGHGNKTISLVATKNGCSSVTTKALVINALSDIQTKMVLYPNPTNNSVQLRFELPQEGYYSIRSLNGSDLKSGMLGRVTNIDISEQPSGVYLLVVTLSNEVIRRKIIKY